MKRFITVIILAAVMVSAAACTGCATDSGFHYKQVKAKKGYVTKFYDGKKYVGKVKTSLRDTEQHGNHPLPDGRRGAGV